MNLILRMNGNEENVSLGVEPRMGAPETVTKIFVCLDCVKTHRWVYRKVGIHDDGVVYEFEGGG